MRADLEPRIVAALRGDLSAAKLAALTDETEVAIRQAEANAEAQRQRSLDPLSSPDPRQARAAMEDAAFRSERLKSLLPRLQARYERVAAAEEREQWKRRYETLKVRRDALSAELVRGLSRISRQARGPVRPPCRHGCRNFQFAPFPSCWCALASGERRVGGAWLDQFHHRQSVNRKGPSIARLGKRRGGALAAPAGALGVSCDRVCACRSCGAELVSQHGGSGSGARCRRQARSGLLRPKSARTGGAGEPWSFEIAGWVFISGLPALRAVYVWSRDKAPAELSGSLGRGPCNVLSRALARTPSELLSLMVALFSNFQTMTDVSVSLQLLAPSEPYG